MMRQRVHHTIGVLCLAVLAALAIFATPAVSGAQAMRATGTAASTTTLDADHDGLVDALEATDTDRDGVVDALDADDDNDGIPTRDERDGDASRDADGDGWADHLDAHDDGPLVSGTIAADIDGDGRPDVLDDRRAPAPAQHPSRGDTHPLSLAVTALALGAVVTRRRA